MDSKDPWPNSIEIYEDSEDEFMDSTEGERDELDESDNPERMELDELDNITDTKLQQTTTCDQEPEPDMDTTMKPEATDSNMGSQTTEKQLYGNNDVDQDSKDTEKGEEKEKGEETGKDNDNENENENETENETENDTETDNDESPNSSQGARRSGRNVHKPDYAAIQKGIKSTRDEADKTNKTTGKQQKEEKLEKELKGIKEEMTRLRQTNKELKEERTKFKQAQEEALTAAKTNERKMEKEEKQRLGALQKQIEEEAKETNKLKTDLRKAQHQLEQDMKNKNDLKKKHEGMEKDLKKKNDEMEKDLRMIKEKLHQEETRNKNTQELLDQALNVEKAQLTTLQVQKEEEERSAKLKETIQQMLEERENALRQTKENEADLRKRIQDLQERLLQANNTIEAVLEKSEGTNVNQEERKNIIILGDSNTKHIMENIESEDDLRITTTKIYTTKDLLDYSHKTPKDINEAHHILIHVGTNDLRKGEHATDIYQNLEKATNSLEEQSGAKITIITPPPIATTSDHEIQRRLLKRAITNRSHHTTITIHEECGLKADCFHIDEASGKRAALDITRHIKGTMKQSKEKEQQKSRNQAQTGHQSTNYE